MTLTLTDSRSDNDHSYQPMNLDLPEELPTSDLLVTDHVPVTAINRKVAEKRLPPSLIEPRVSKRVRKQPTHLNDYVL